MANNLSPRERDVIDALLAGHTTAGELKAALCLSSSGVVCHISHIYQKTGAYTKAGLVLWALRNGWTLPEANRGEA